MSEITKEETLKQISDLEKQLSELQEEKESINKQLLVQMEEAEYQACEANLFPFYQAAWPIYETGDFISNWHMEVICEALEELYKGTIENLIIQIPPGCSKLLANDTLIPTPQGLTKHGDLKVGDTVYHSSGEEITVTHVHPKGFANYKITFSNKQIIYCNGDHIWEVLCLDYMTFKLVKTRDLFRNNQYKNYIIKKQTDNTYISFSSIKRLQPKEYQEGNCITVSAEDGMYLCGITKIPTHNSTISCVAFPAWAWIQDPTLRFMTASVVDRLTLRDAVRTRNLIQSSWYQKRWGSKFELLKGENSKSLYKNNYNGYRLATSVAGSSIGERFDILCNHEDNLVKTNFGNISIGELYKKYRHNKKLEVETTNLGTGVTSFVKPNSIIRNRRYFRKLVKITFPDNSELKVTEDHKFWSEDYEIYIKAIDLESFNNYIKVEYIKEKPKYVYTMHVPPYYNYTEVSSSGEYVLVSKNCIDDPHKPNEMASQVKKDAVWEWYSGTISTRSSARGKQVLIHQRLATDDLIGRVLELEENWEVVNLPMKYEKEVVYPWTETNVLPNRDPRTEKDELLFPVIHPKKKVEKLEKKLGTYGSAAQLQQRPISLEGGLVKRKHFSYYEKGSMRSFLSRCQLLVGSWDLAFGIAGNSYCVGEVWAIQEGNKKFLVDEYRGKWEWPQQKSKMIQMLNDYPTIRTLLVEKKANGEGLIAALNKDIANAMVRPVNILPIEANKSKEVRLYMCISDFESGNVHILNPKKYEWVEEYVDELTTFPVGKYDDRVDSTTMFLNWSATNFSHLQQLVVNQDDISKIKKLNKNLEEYSSQTVLYPGNLSSTYIFGDSSLGSLQFDSLF